MESLGRFAVQRARLVLVAALLAVIASGELGFGAFGNLMMGGFQDAGAESTDRADRPLPACSSAIGTPSQSDSLSD
jgi:hypothetical protein